MPRIMRYALYLICVVQLFFAVAFILQLPFAVDLWPFEGTTPLSFIFISSIFAAAAAATLWTLVTGNDGALAGLSLDYVFILAPVAILAFQLGASSGNTHITGFGFVCLLGALFGLGLLLWSIRRPLDTSLPMPAFVRLAFVIFIIVLLVVAAALLLKTPNVIPWTITPELSIVIAWMFLGAAAYFAYALLRPSWANAGGQLAGFLAYDLVLIVPFLQRLSTVSDELRLSLYIYTAAVTVSGLIAIYYLFINPPTRLFSRRST